MAHRIQDRLLYDKEDITAEKELMMAEWEIWRIILARLGFNTKDVAAASEKIAMLESMIPVFKDAEEFYRHSRMELTNINGEYSHLQRQLDAQQLMQQVEQMRMTGVSAMLLLSPSPDEDARSADITADIEDVVRSIEQGAWALRRAKERWVEFQVEYSNALFGKGRVG